MKHLLIVLITMLISIAIHAQDTGVYAPEKGGMLLTIKDHSFHISGDETLSTAFQFEDGTDVDFDFRNQNGFKVKKVKKLMKRFGWVTVRIGSASTHKWRLYNYNLLHGRNIYK